MSVEGPHWGSGWYVRKRHVYEMQVADVSGFVRAICSQYTYVYPNGYKSMTHSVPLADTEATLALPACKTCLKRIGAL